MFYWMDVFTTFIIESVKSNLYDVYIGALIAILFVVSLIPAVILLLDILRPRDPDVIAKKIPVLEKSVLVPTEEEVKPKVMRAHA